MSEAIVEPRAEFLRIRLPGPPADTADFHYFWLRHNCECCRHPVTHERTLCSSDVPMDIRPERVVAGSEGVTIFWADSADRHRSEYSYDWLRRHAYGAGRGAIEPPAGDIARLEIRGDGNWMELLGRCLERVAEYGAALARGFGDETEKIVDAFAAGGLDVIETHFGRIEDLRTDNTTNQNTDQLGYTDAAVELHTDQPFLEVPPRYQLLHCMRPAARGGENTIADARQAALYLRSLDAGAFELLTEVEVCFLRQQKNFAKALRAPIIELRDEEVYRVRSSYFTMAPHRLPFERMEAWYRAYNRFARLVRQPEHQYRFLLRAGDFLLYDNYRMLHARTQFEGPRWLRGVYFDATKRHEKGRET